MICQSASAHYGRCGLNAFDTNHTFSSISNELVLRSSLVERSTKRHVACLNPNTVAITNNACQQCKHASKPIEELDLFGLALRSCWRYAVHGTGSPSDIISAKIYDRIAVRTALSR